MYRRILLAYDGSLEGAVALREGALLARRCRAKVYILSVVPEAGGVILAEGVSAGAVSLQMESYEALLNRAVERLQSLGLDATKRLAMGDPVKLISAFAKEVTADLVVVGYHKRNMIGRWWSGSTGAYISDHVKCSILIARKQVSDEAFEAELTQMAEEGASA